MTAIASRYPLGGQVTVSTERWDVRGALVDSAPTRIHVIGGGTNPGPTPVVEGGAGITPKTGVRLGVSFTHGAYLKGDELVTKGPNDRRSCGPVAGGSCALHVRNETARRARVDGADVGAQEILNWIRC